MFEWVKGIVFYLILLTVISHLLPGHKYDKYVRLFTGMLLIMIVIKPITHLFSWDNIFDKNFLDITGAWADSGLDEDFLQDLEGAQEKQLQEEYERQTQQFVKTQAQNFGFNITRCVIKTAWKDDVICVNYMQLEVKDMGEDKMGETIEQVSIADVVLEEQAQGGADSRYAQFRSALAGYYGLSVENIQIRGHG